MREAIWRDLEQITEEWTATRIPRNRVRKIANLKGILIPPELQWLQHGVLTLPESLVPYQWEFTVNEKYRNRCIWRIIISFVAFCNVIMLVLMIKMGSQVPSPESVKNECNRAFEIDIRMGRWDNARSLKMVDHALVGDKFLNLSKEYPVCLATQTSLDKLDELIDIVQHWNASISAAVLVAGNDEYAILQHYVDFLRRCFPKIKDTVSFQVAFPKERIPTAYCYNEKPSLLNCKKPEKTLNALLTLRSVETMNWRGEYWYPQNHMRNLARKNCQSNHVFLVDIDIIPSVGMAEQVREFLKSTECKDKCAYVVPTYEMPYVVPFPQNKYQLLLLAQEKYARPYHFTTFYENQAATDFPRWEKDTMSQIHISYEVKNVQFPYEPFYMAPDNAPAHDERFVGYGYTKSSQVFEMVEAGWKFFVLSPVFTVHYGVAHDRQPLFRSVQNAYNRENIQSFKREASLRYQAMKNKNVRPKTKETLGNKKRS